jgi:hypothetical protein
MGNVCRRIAEDSNRLLPTTISRTIASQRNRTGLSNSRGVAQPRHNGHEPGWLPTGRFYAWRVPKPQTVCTYAGQRHTWSLLKLAPFTSRPEASSSPSSYAKAPPKCRRTPSVRLESRYHIYRKLRLAVSLDFTSRLLMQVSMSGRRITVAELTPPTGSPLRLRFAARRSGNPAPVDHAR